MLPRASNWVLAGALLSVAGCTSSTPTDTAMLEPDAVAEVLDIVAEEFGEIDPDAHAFPASVDLNGDGRPEVIVHVAGPTLCGTGGCTTLVFSHDDEGYALVSEIAPARPPIQVSARATNGWRNLLVHVSGGGLEAAYDAELAFDGTRYPGNPTDAHVPPAADTRGAETVIEPYGQFTEGTPLVAP